MTWRVAKSLLHLREQVDRLFPNRNKENDGTIGDTAHATRTSDHNPWVDGGVVTAMDITHDPHHGFDSYKFAEELRRARDPRVKYVISNRRIFSTQAAPYVWRAYNGSNPHDHHVHISVLPNRLKYDNVTDWKTPMLRNTSTVLDKNPDIAQSTFHEHIVATEFGGPNDLNKSAYDQHTITNSELGVALPYHFTGKRPQVRVHGPKGSAVGNIVDVGPWNTNDPYWTTNNRPQAEGGIDHSGRHTNHAGIDITPALARKIGISGKGLVNWEFVTSELPKAPQTPSIVTVGTGVIVAGTAASATVGAATVGWPWYEVALLLAGIMGLAVAGYELYKYIRKHQSNVTNT